MEANPEREIRDMEIKLEGLEESISLLEGVVKSDILDSMQGVIDEWSSTKDCIESLRDELEVLEVAQ